MKDNQNNQHICYHKLRTANILNILKFIYT